jgi:hypothetical protein
MVTSYWLFRKSVCCWLVFDLASLQLAETRFWPRVAEAPWLIQFDHRAQEDQPIEQLIDFTINICY